MRNPIPSLFTVYPSLTFGRRLLFIIHSSLFILLSLFILHSSFFISGCSSSTKPKTGSLSGRIILVNDTGDPSLDPVYFSGITVALYELAELDTTIVRINQEYPQIGVPINQETQFDHRFQNPVKTTVTSADGSYTIASIPMGKYNMVVFKAGWGISYYNNIDIQEDKGLHMNKPAGEMFLYPQHELPATIQGSMDFLTGHTYLVSNDTIILGSSNIFSNASIFIEPNVTLAFYGQVYVDSSTDSYFKITSADGMYSLDKMLTLQRYNKIAFSYSGDINLENLIAQHGTNGIQCSGASFHLSNTVISDMLSAALNTTDSEVNMNNVWINDCSDKGAYLKANSIINRCIFSNSKDALFLSESASLVSNCYFSNNRIAVLSLYGRDEIKNNNFDKNLYAISVCAATPTIMLNDFYDNNTDIESNKSWVSYQVNQYSNPTITDNNFFGNKIYISLYGKNIIGGSSDTQGIGVNEDQSYPNNYFKETNLTTHLFDANYPGSGIQYTINYIPRRMSLNPNAGIQ